MKKILCIDGGGIRGVIPAVILEAIEMSTGKRIDELFDFISGTSVGGIIACCIAHGYRGEEIVNLFREDGRSIFPKTAFTKIKGLFRAKYSSDRLREILHSYLGDVRLSEVGKPELMIPSYELGMMSPFIFRSTRAKVDREYDYLLVDVAMATSAAPTYFEPARIWSIGGRGYQCIDGGMYANNPAMMAYIDATRGMNDRSDIMVVSIGTGQESVSVKIGGWGLSNWIRPLLDVIFDGIGDTVSYELSQILKDGNYYRLQTKVKGGLDDVDRIDEYMETAGKIIASNEFSRLCLRLGQS